MTACVHRDVIGADMCVVFDDSAVRWERDPPAGALVYTGSHKESMCLDTVIKLAASGAAVTIPPAYAVMAAQAFPNIERVMWSHVLPKSVLKRCLMDFVARVRDDSVESLRPYYEGTWERVGSFLKTLQPAYIDDECAGVVTYDRLSTRTGRMIVASGLKVLTMSRDVRAKIRGASGAPVMYVDFRALEPTLVANAVGLRFEGSDLYAWLAEHVIRASSRDVAKRAVVCALYGSKESRTSDAAKIANVFQLDALAADIRRASLRGERVTSLYGRVVRSEQYGDDGCVINDRFQSTAVDAACEGFAAICGDSGALPLAVVHDAVIVEDTKAALSDGQIGTVELPTVGKLYFKVTRLS